MKKLLTLLLALAMLLSMAAVAEAPDTSVESTDAAAAELGIPAAVTLHDTDALSGKKIGCSIARRSPTLSRRWALTTARTSPLRTAT